MFRATTQKVVDMWSGNVMVDCSTKSLRALIDWQLIGIGSAAEDITCLALYCLNATDRREMMRELITEQICAFNELAGEGSHSVDEVCIWRIFVSFICPLQLLAESKALLPYVALSQMAFILSQLPKYGQGSTERVRFVEKVRPAFATMENMSYS